MHQVKLVAAASSTDDRESSECTEPSEATEDMDESLQLPWPIEDQEESDFDGSVLEDSDKDPEVTNASLQEEIRGIYEDWIFSLNRDDHKMMAMMMYDCFMTQFGLLKTAASVEVGQVLHVSDKTI